MAKNVFDPEKTYSIKLYGHAFTLFPQTFGEPYPVLSGHFAADTYEVPEGEDFGGFTEFAEFTVDEPTGKAYSHGWVGTYRIPVCMLREHEPQLFEDISS